MAADIRVRRVYADPQPDNGARVLVDRVWPRGPAQGRGAAGRLGEGRRAVRRAADLVPARPCEVRRVPSPPLYRRTCSSRGAGGA